MLEHIPDEDIRTAIDTLAELVGVREPVSCDYICAPIRRGKKDRRSFAECAERIAGSYYLPVKIDLSFGEDFRSSDLVEHREGRTGGITAQVCLPSFMPMFGTRALKDLTISVKVSPILREHMETFIACVAHELSHVLLMTLRSPHHNNELFVDLVPLLLGFGQIVRDGRRVVSSRCLTETATYGYLTDAQVEVANRYVTTKLANCREIQDRVWRSVRSYRDCLARYKKDVACAKQALGHLESHPPRSGDFANAQRISVLHQHSFWDDIDRTIQKHEESVRLVEDVDLEAEHYSPQYSERLRTIDHDLSSWIRNIQVEIDILRKDLRILKRQCRASWRIRKVLGWFSRRRTGTRT